MKKLLSRTALLMIMGAVPGYAATISTNLDVTVVPAPSAGPASCNGGSFGTTVSNLNPTAGSTVSVSFACASGGHYLAWGSTNGVVTAVYPTPTGGAASGTVGMRVPNVVSDRPLDWRVELLADAGSGLVAVSPSSPITVPKTYTEVLGNALPASAGGDPFVPAHVITVCPSGCNFSSPQDAIDQAQGNGWDNVEITVQVAEYIFNNTGSGPGNNRNLLNVQSAPHIWIKGIVGASGTDGTAKPWIHGTDMNGANLIITGVGAGNVTIDNLEIGPFNAWATQLNAANTTLRNVYVRDSQQGMISSDGHHHNLTVYNSHFARHGSGNEHNLYAGSGDDTDTLTIQNSIFEQAYQGHDIKSRASSTFITCDKIMINADDVFDGSEMTDCSEGRVCAPHNSLYVQGGGNPGWSSENSFDAIRFGSNRFFQTLTNNQVDAQGNVFVEDAPVGPYEFITLFKRFSPSPHTISNNKFVFYNSAAMLNNNNPFQPERDWDFNTASGSSVIVFGATEDAATSADITLDSTNHWYAGRSAAGLPAIGTYPLSFNDASFAGVMPAACTDPIGTVRTPAN